MSDTIAGIYGALSSDPSKFGTPWIYGDGPNYSGTPARSASNPSFQYWQDITADISGHAGGQVIYRFFRRLKEVSAADYQRLLGIALGTLATIKDADGNGQIDAGDFRRAVLETLKSNETTLKNAVHTVYAELYKPQASGPQGPPLPPGEPGPPGAPAAPASLWGSFLNCGTYQGSPVTIYQAWWSASANAIDYGLFAKTTQEPAYRYTGTTTGTTGFIYTNTTGDGRVNACNASGCSGLTLNRVVVSHQPQCGGF